jgi:hypothetical protein
VSSGRHHKEWSARGGIERAATADQLRAERARTLIAAAQARIAAAKPKALMRPGVSVPTTLRYATRRLDSRIARLAIHAASGIALFVIETWQKKFPAKPLHAHSR